MNSLVVFRKNVPQPRATPSQSQPMASRSKTRTAKTGSLITPVVTQPRNQKAGSTRSPVPDQATRPSRKRTPKKQVSMVDFVALYRDLCCSSDHTPKERRSSSFLRDDSATGVVVRMPEKYPRAELMLEFNYSDPPVPEISPEMWNAYGRDYHSSL